MRWRDRFTFGVGLPRVGVAPQVGVTESNTLAWHHQLE